MLTFLLLAAAAPAATPTPGPQTLHAMAEYKSADGLMIAQWRITNAFMKGKDAQDHKRTGFHFATALLDSQRAWIKFRDSACRVEGGEYAGDIRQRMIVFQCKTALTNDRTRQLKGLMVVQP